MKRKLKLKWIRGAKRKFYSIVVNVFYKIYVMMYDLRTVILQSRYIDRQRRRQREKEGDRKLIQPSSRREKNTLARHASIALWFICFVSLHRYLFCDLQHCQQPNRNFTFIKAHKNTQLQCKTNSHKNVGTNVHTAINSNESLFSNQKIAKYNHSVVHHTIVKCIPSGCAFDDFDSAILEHSYNSNNLHIESFELHKTRTKSSGKFSSKSF